LRQFGTNFGDNGVFGRFGVVVRDQVIVAVVEVDEATGVVDVTFEGGEENKVDIRIN